MEPSRCWWRAGLETQNPGRPTEKEGRNAEIVKKSSLQIEREKQWLVVAVLAQAFMGSLFTAEKGSSESGSATKWIYKKNQCEIALFKSAEVS